MAGPDTSGRYAIARGATVICFLPIAWAATRGWIASRARSHFYDFDETTRQLVHTPGSVQAKYLNDAGTFPLGFVTIGDTWINYWRSGPNAFVGWNGPGSGQGAKSLGTELAQTRMFSECQVKQVFEKICYRTPNGAADVQAVQTIANSFEANNRSMKRVFAETSAYCMGN